MDQKISNGKFYQNKKPFAVFFLSVFRSVINKHTHLKREIIRGNDAPFMKKNSVRQY